MISPRITKLLAQPWFYASAGAIIVWLVIVAHSQGAGGGAVLSAALNYSVFFAIVGLGQMLVMASGAGNIDLSIPANIAFGRLSLHGPDGGAPQWPIAESGRRRRGIAIGAANASSWRPDPPGGDLASGLVVDPSPCLFPHLGRQPRPCWSISPPSASAGCRL